VPALIQALGDDDWDVRRAAAEALVKIGTPAVPALIQALGDSDWDVRRAAAEALGAIGDPQAVPALIQTLRDRSEMFAVRQRRRWANSATPKPCPRSSKHWGMVGMMFAVRHNKPFSKSKRSSLKQNDLSFSGGCPMKHEDDFAD
jgi:hypothetical protein